jgi:hypothetical protein
MKRFLVLLLAGLVMGVEFVAPALQTQAANHSALAAAKGTPSTKTTKYPLAGISFAMSLAAGLKLEEQGTLDGGACNASIVAGCTRRPV